jgi:MYXO-CTERM domain-containing protein
MPTNYKPVVNNSYFFNNTANGSNVTASVNPSGNPTACTVTENSNWWNYNPACTSSSCTAGIGTGTAIPTGTCTTGTGYWVASTPTPTAAASVIQGGAFYQCTATNVWTKYYTPYCYPHPLRGSACNAVGNTDGGTPDSGAGSDLGTEPDLAAGGDMAAAGNVDMASGMPSSGCGCRVGGHSSGRPFKLFVVGILFLVIFDLRRRLNFIGEARRTRP